MMVNKIYNMDCREGLKDLPDNSVDCGVTSPPYFGLRNYGHVMQMGLEKTSGMYIDEMTGVFSEFKRVLKPEGTLWINIGDSYGPDKNLQMIPARLALALQADGWIIRSSIIWNKKNCMPESVKDRPTCSHEYIYLFTKSPKYYYNSEAIKEPCIWDIDGTGTKARKERANDNAKSVPTDKHNGIRAGGFKDAAKFGGKNEELGKRTYSGFNERWDASGGLAMRNKRTVWTIAPAQFPEAHFATFPEEIPEICIKAGCPEDGTVLDPFMGAGTTALVASKLNRNYIGFELNPDYIKIADKRLQNELGLFNKRA